MTASEQWPAASSGAIGLPREQPGDEHSDGQFPSDEHPDDQLLSDELSGDQLPEGVSDRIRAGAR